jgi:carbonic anhydrase
MDVFRSLHENPLGSTQSQQLVNNFRTPQPLNDRNVYRTFDLSFFEKGWNYEDITSWYLVHPNCAGPQQSPIDISTGRLQNRNDWGDFVFTGYSGQSSVNLTNTGQSIEGLVNPQTSDLRFSGGGLSDQYSLYKILFHWGADDTYGSEHTVDGKAFPLEIQLIHFNKKYGSSINASYYPQGFAVLSVFGQIARNGSTALLDKSNAVVDPESSKIETFVGETLLPGNVKNFYRYNGSLTIPDCTESVIWTVFTEPLSVTVEQMTALRQVKTDAPDEPSQVSSTVTSLKKKNGRPVQSLNDRTVYRCTSVVTGSATSPIYSVQTAALVLGLLVAVFSS